MAESFSMPISVDSDKTYGFADVSQYEIWEQVFNINSVSCSANLGAPASAIIYATTAASVDQLTDDNKIATVTFSGSGWHIQGVVTLLDNGKKLSGKKYWAIKKPSSGNTSSFIVSISYNPADTVKIKTGEGFQECYPMLYNGTEFVPCLVNRYDGTAFEECTHIELVNNA